MFAENVKAPANAIKNFRLKTDKPQLKGAWVDSSVFIGDDQLTNLINLKSKEDLIGDIIHLLQSPAKNVIGALQANAGQKIAGLVKTLSER
jgi:large subunit ribosomal protein L10